MNRFILLIFVFVFFQCKKNEDFKPITNLIEKEISFSNPLKDDKEWHLKDILLDSMPGISYDRAFNTIIKRTEGTPIVIAILDTKIDINHKSLKNKIWVNNDEIADNSIDDDSNGFIDDVNGWNFLGNSNGESVVIENYEYVRILRQHQNILENSPNIDTLNYDYKNYIRAKKHYDKKIISYNKRYHSTNKMMSFYYESRAALKEYFPDYNYSYEKLNKIDTVGNGLGKYVNEIKSVLDYNDFDQNMERNYISLLNTYNKKLNINYFPRKLVGDDPTNIKDSIYGNNIVSDYVNIIDHGTRVAGFLSSLTNKENIKLMPVVIVPEGGSTQDKDIALGIKYAVDNGAKVINMSFGKNFASKTKWLMEAFLYAEEHNVLIVSATGNSGKNIDDDIHIYPHDSYNKEPEFCSNFLYVGASSKDVNSSLVTYSDYGKKNVDIFAPGEDVHTSFPNNINKFDSGTSLSSAIVAGVAGLLYSYYPNLTATQVKHIIMDSGVEYTFPVKTPTTEDKNKMTPFNELSKSGKIVNAYNALIMADSISRKR